MVHRRHIDLQKENLLIFRLRSKNVSEQERLALHQIAKAIISERESDNLIDIAESYRKVTEPGGAIDCLILAQAVNDDPLLRQHAKSACFIGTENYILPGSHSRIAFTKNEINEIAFEIFSGRINNAKAVPTRSLEDACESVNSGESEFCILPIENMGSGKLLGFYSMLDRYELKICDICDVESDENANTVRYALAGKNCKEPSERSVQNNDYIFEFTIADTNGNFICQLQNIISCCGADLISVNSRPAQYDVQLQRFIFTVRLHGTKLLLLRTALVMSYNSYIPIGFYTERAKARPTTST